MESDNVYANCTDYVRSKKEREQAQENLNVKKSKEKSYNGKVYTLKGKNGLVITTRSKERLEEFKELLGL